MQHYITRRKHNWEGTTCTEDITIVQKFLAANKTVGLDIEANGLDSRSDILLLGLSSNTDYIVIDREFINPNNFDFANNKIVGHNLKYDYSILALLGFSFGTFYDIMIAEQKAYQGMQIGDSSEFGLPMNLAAIVHRYYPKVTLSKDDRKEFIGVDPNNFIPQKRHIDYLFNDIRYLLPLMKAQEPILNNFKFYLEKIGFELIRVVGDMENEGLTINLKQVEANDQYLKQQKHEVANAFDVAVREYARVHLSKSELNAINPILKVNRTFTSMPTQLGLFGEAISNKDLKRPKKVNSGMVNLNSATAITKLFAHIGLPLPMVTERGTQYSVPKYDKDNKLISKNGKFTTNKKELELMVVENPNIEGIDIYKKLIAYRRFEKFESTYGLALLEKLNKHTGKLHTLYRTENAKTGRFQSGGGKNQKDKINSQNIPRESRYRDMVIAPEGYSLLTVDLSGAEVTIICDKAHDEQLYQWAVINDDAHSPIAQTCWRNIYLYRAGLVAGVWRNHYEFEDQLDNPRAHLLIKANTYGAHYYNHYESFIIDKKTNKDMRTDFKPITFGALYGMFPNKCAKTLKINKDEGYIVINTMKKTIPDSFRFVESQAELALEQGYLTLNDRTKEIILFPPIIMHKRGEYKLKDGDKTDVEGTARNCLIQGTQASMIKEAMVRLYKTFKLNNIDAKLILQVHDELVVQVNDKELTKQFGRFNFAELVTYIMCETANLYLKHYKMGAEAVLDKKWKK